MSASVGMRSLAISFPARSARTTSGASATRAWSQEGGAKTLARLWKANERAAPVDPFELAMAPYLRDPFRGARGGACSIQVSPPRRSSSTARAARSTPRACAPTRVGLLVASSFLPDQVGRRQRDPARQGAPATGAPPGTSRRPARGARRAAERLRADPRRRVRDGARDRLVHLLARRRRGRHACAGSSATAPARSWSARRRRARATSARRRSTPATPATPSSTRSSPTRAVRASAWTARPRPGACSPRRASPTCARRARARRRRPA